jgi:sucrose phosphorylase
MGRDDVRYLLARAIQFFLPGIPQVYYVGLLAGANDMELLQQTQVGRDINRHHYTRDEISAALQRPVVRDLLGLIHLRNAHPAFQGSFALQDSADDALDMHWSNGAAFARLRVNLRSGVHQLEASGEPLAHFQLLNVATPIAA